ncbi:hypothetical protein AGMMS49545_22610 [Betaproteobacteria bacterium]|nr:hypothetical protein AGMMS49545_22610 [Betaproteobacteria bacterium]GHU49830.1 hypothetical protein AGMMS50289_26760 [Betaproteobacteria bacterium]
MANNVALGAIIGGAVSANFGKSISDSIAKIGAFSQRAAHFPAEQQRIDRRFHYVA